MCQEQEEKLQVLIAHLQKERDVLTQQLRSLPKFLSKEFFYQQNDTVAVVKAQSNNIEKITGFMTYLQFGDGTLQLGDRSIVVPQGLYISPPVQILLQKTDKRSLTSSSATKGLISLDLFGEEMGDTLIW